MNENANSPRPLFVCLTGFMGAGKSTVGASLAELLGWRFIDLDQEVVRSKGRSVTEIFASEGEGKFRQIESEVLRGELQHTSGPSVIALGGGTFVQQANRDLLASHGAKTVYLEAEFDLLYSRCCQEKGTRPLLQDPAAFRALFEARCPLYRTADTSVTVAGRSPAEIAKTIAERLALKSAR